MPLFLVFWPLTISRIEFSFKGMTYNAITQFVKASLRKRCPYSELFWSAFSRAVQMQENADQNNSEYRHFSRSAFYHFL